jgi:beta-glucanase (GH16 family)
VFEIAKKFGSFDTTPTLEDIQGMYPRSPDSFFVAEDDSGQVIGFISGYERKGLPEE